MRNIWEGYRGEYQTGISEDNPLVEFVRRWIGSHECRNVGRWVRTGEMHRELNDHYGRAFTSMYRSSGSFGRKLKENQSALRSLGVDTKRLDGNQMYCFNPSGVEVGNCRNSFRDSASRQHLGDP
jgi:hypothetical protein